MAIMPFTFAQESNPLIHQCKIHGEGGIHIFKKGLGRIVECELYDLNIPAIRISSEGNPSIQRCHIHHFEGNGIYIDGKGCGQD